MRVRLQARLERLERNQERRSTLVSYDHGQEVFTEAWLTEFWQVVKESGYEADILNVLAHGGIPCEQANWPDYGD
jgi:hypothetical protein